jgi:hypothetical protein
MDNLKKNELALEAKSFRYSIGQNLLGELRAIQTYQNFLKHLASFLGQKIAIIFYLHK